MEPVCTVSDEHAAKRHLIILVNGLFGSAENWDVIVECLQVRRVPLTTSRVALTMSTEKDRLQT